MLAQTIDLSAVTGRVLDPQGKSIAGADVTLNNTGTGLTKSVKTDSNGDYKFAGLPITDNYAVKAEASGFKPGEQQNIALRANQAVVVNFTMTVSGAQTQVTVYGTPGSVTVDSDKVTTRFDVQKIEDTPILNRKITAIPLLDSSVRQAQTTGDLFINEVLFVINGTGRRQTTYDLDNTTANDSWGRQTMFAAIPFSAVQELNVDKNSISSEYGRNAGTAVDVVTKSGSNQWHGDFIGMGRPQFSEAAQPLAAKPAYNTLAQGSAMVSGPIVKDKTFFLASYEYTNQNRDAVITSPVDPGAIYSGTFNQNLFFGRIDHQFSQNNLLTIRGNFDRFTDSNPQDAVSGVNLPTTARTFARNTYQAALVDTATLTPNVVNEARFEFLLGSPITQFLPVVQAPQEFISGIYTNGESRVANLSNHQYQWADTLNWTKGKHQIRTGFDVVYSSSGGYGTEFGSGYLQGRFQVNSAYANIPIPTLLTYDPGLPPPGAPPKSPPLVSAFTQSFGTATYNEKETLAGVFVQDNWRVTPNLVVNLGLRYDLQTLTEGHTNFSPRVGLAYTLFGGDNPTVIRGGYGIYYTELPANIVANSSYQWTARRLHLHRAAGTVRVPEHLQPHYQPSTGDRTAGARYPDTCGTVRLSQPVPAGFAAPLLPQQAGESVHAAVGLRHRATDRQKLGVLDGLHRVTHHSHQPAHRFEFALRVCTYCARTGPQRERCQRDPSDYPGARRISSGSGLHEPGHVVLRRTAGSAQKAVLNPLRPSRQLYLVTHHRYGRVGRYGPEPERLQLPGNLREGS